MSRWTLMACPAGGVSLVPAEAASVHLARGWRVADPPPGVDLDDPHAPLAFAEDSVTMAGHGSRSPQATSTQGNVKRRNPAPTEKED